MSPVAAAWIDGVRRLGGSPDEAARTAGDLERRYREPHRGYHNLAHVRSVLTDSRWLCDELAVDGTDRDRVVLAVCAHDVVYDARPGDDERASAQWASDELAAAGVDGARVADLVLMTITHTGDPGDAGAAALLDADLAILAADPPGYGDYVRGVRAEYAAVPAAVWRAGRAKVLDGLLARPELYLSRPAQDRWENAARRNLLAERAALA